MRIRSPAATGEVVEAFVRTPPVYELRPIPFVLSTHDANPDASLPK